MQMKTIHKTLSTVALGAALTFGASFSASALPQFQVNPGAIGSAQGIFTADHIVGNSSTLVTYNPGTDSISGQGWLQFSAFTLNGTAVNSNVGSYNLYALFTYSAPRDAGSAAYGVPGSTYTLNGLHFDLYANPANNTTFVEANANTSTAATAAGGAPVTIGSGDLIVGTAGLNALGGSFLNATNSYANTSPLGDAYFFDPSPFYTIAFNSIINNTSGIVRNGNLTSVNATSTSTDFMVGGNNVPEPGSLALFGAALVGLFVSRRRKSA